MGNFALNKENSNNNNSNGNSNTNSNTNNKRLHITVHQPSNYSLDGLKQAAIDNDNDDDDDDSSEELQSEIGSQISLVPS